MSIFDMLDQEKEVVADAPPVNGEIIDKSNVIGVVARYLATTKVGQRGTAKHVFRIPSGETFALWGDAALNALLKKIKPNDVVGMIYQGKRPGLDGNEAHTWRLVLITSTGDQLRAMITAAEDAYKGVRAAVAMAKTDRQQKFPGRQPGDEAPPPSDEDKPAW